MEILISGAYLDPVVEVLVPGALLDPVVEILIPGASLVYFPITTLTSTSDPFGCGGMTLPSIGSPLTVIATFPPSSPSGFSTVML